MWDLVQIAFSQKKPRSNSQWVVFFCRANILDHFFFMFIKLN